MIRQFARNNGSDGMKNIFTGQIECQRNFRFAGRFIMSLPVHNFRTGKPQLDSRIRMDHIINTTVIREKTAEHLAIRCVDNSVNRKSGNISLP